MASDDRGMPGGGEITLVAYGSQNVQLSGNPDQTYFYKVFKRYTHFSQESITIPMEGPNELNMDYPTRIRAKIPRHGDLLTDLTFVFRVPEMYSKVIDEATTSPAFRWIHALGPLLIDNVSIHIAGSKIQEFPGEWLVARATLDYPVDQYLKWRSLVGDVPELHTPEWGIYGRSANYPFTAGTYPNVVLDPSGFPTAPSVPEREIRVPLPFWFTESWGAALPLVALQLHEVEVQITLRTLREIYRILDSDYKSELVRCGRALAIDNDKPKYIDPYGPLSPVFDNLTLQDDYYSTNDCNATPRFFFTDAGQPVPAQDGFDLRPRLEGNYIYLTEKEKQMFAERELTHMVHQIQTFRFPSIVTRSKLDLDSHGIVQRLVFYGRRSDAIESRNDYINCSNWKNRGQAPYWPIPSTISSTGRLIDFAQRDILRSARLMLAGNEAFEEKPAAFFEAQTAFTHMTGQGFTLGSVGIKPDDVMGPLYQISFALNGSDHENPSGVLNTSRVREIQLEVTPWELDPLSNYVYDFTVFVESINFVKYINGMAGLQYAI
jgi:hypothetical protein